ncbi:GntR family transcriptional regulator [Skermanella stibiiresistens SB22]|uniref:GntR family transcriptional regulator n=1 Tax=Skermanella stibiiresistens SB22 TaxID=1385369 RepID=W9GZ06_9PROT|nr:PLP-dependent aminotransferase family protein [Skermanella stibiiresistens]EWY39140.1 GntR family transcriptional regulator [Skermanella stibiiresistens SB22]
MIDWDARYAKRAGRMAASEIRELLKLLEQPDIISFAGGIPDPALFPQAEIAASYHGILSDPARAAAALQYSVSEGYPPLREWLAGYMANLGVPCGRDNIIITNGSQQALDFLGRLFINPGDPVLVSDPTYLGALQAFNSYEPSYVHFPHDLAGAAGFEPGGAKPAFGYIMPDFQNPTGVSMDMAEREAVLGLTHKLDIPLIEDAAYEKLRYDGEPLPPLLALECERAGGIDNGRVIYCGTFSKTVVPALRLGWVVAPREVIRKLVLIKQASDLHSATLNQMVMFEVASKTLDANIGRIRSTYKARRDAMLAALESHMPQEVTWTKPLGGMFIWVTMPERLDGAKVLHRAIDEARVAFVPGGAFRSDASGRNTFRLSFSLSDVDSIAKGIERLGDVLKSAIEANAD